MYSKIGDVPQEEIDQSKQKGGFGQWKNQTVIGL
jgi:hypothetical protein